jgi:hypothetical protein
MVIVTRSSALAASNTTPATLLPISEAMSEHRLGHVGDSGELGGQRRPHQLIARMISTHVFRRFGSLVKMATVAATRRMAVLLV